MEIYYPVDAITARLFKAIETINQKNLSLEQTTLEEYLSLFLTFFSDVSKVTGTSVDLAKARSKLFEYGFAILVSQHSGKLYTDPDVEGLMGLAFDRTLRALKL
ncbi:hypothetical protein [Fortiea contorta]|uniref:hypothetical protein n=1 Tax=Fortiea contorta TaxID=1892405 RepID=UPI000346C572|nr:hypothetical protein [Fortiea contorta]